MAANRKSSGFNIHIIAINLIILLGYTVALRFFEANEANFIIDALLIFLQFLICILGAGMYGKFRKEFVLSSVLVLLIGFSTCYLAIH